MTIDFINSKSDVRRQLEKAQRTIEKMRAEAEKPKRDFKLGAAIDHGLLEIAVHIPVGVAIGISCFGWEQYGAFAFGLVPLTCALSFLLSRVYSMVLKAESFDVAAGLIIIGAGAFVMEAYGVHLGLERFNAQNATMGLQTFDPIMLWIVSGVLGIINVWARRAFITGHQRLADDHLRPQSRWFRKKRDANFFGGIARNNDAPRLRDMPADFARDCFTRNGGWPLGYKPTAEDLAAVAA